VIDDPDQLDLVLDSIPRIPGIGEIALRRIKEIKSFTAKSSQTVGKLFKSLPEYPKNINMSGFSFNSEQILLALGEAQAIVEELDLSSNPKLDQEGLKSLLPLLPNLRRLNLIETSISTSDLRELFKTDSKMFYHLDYVLHPLFANPEEPLPPQALVTFRVDWGPSSFYQDEDGSVRSLPLLSTDNFIHYTHEVLVRGLATALTSYPGFSWSLLEAVVASNPQATSNASWNQRSITFVPRTIKKPEHYTEIPAQSSSYHFILSRERVEGDDENPFRLKYGIVVTQKPGLNGLKDVTEFQVLDFETFLRRLESEGRRLTPSNREMIQEVSNVIQEKQVSLVTAEEILERRYRM